MIILLQNAAIGLATTFKHMFKKPGTVQYPKVLRQIHPRFRGAIGMVRDSETGRERCVGCGLCSAVCPANCLTVVPGVDEYGLRIARIYLYDMSRCVFCAMCVEVCPELALVATHEFELSVDDRSQLVLDKEAMLKLSDKHGERYGEPIEEPGFPAVSNADSTILRHDQLDPRIQRGNFQSHQPLLGTLPHGYPMPYKTFVEKAQSGAPLAEGNLHPVLQGVQNRYLPPAERKPMSPGSLELAEGMYEPTDSRTTLHTAADIPEDQITPATRANSIDDNYASRPKILGDAGVTLPAPDGMETRQLPQGKKRK